MQITKMRYTLIFFLIGLMACNKNKYNTIPTLKYKSVNTTVLRPGNIIQFRLKFTDLEGDLTDTLFVIKFDPKCAASGFKEKYKLPSFPTSKNQDGEMLVTYGYNFTGGGVPPITGPQCAGRNDTCVFKFVLKDKAQNKSDTAVSETIVITR